MIHRDTLPLPLLVEHPREFANTAPAVHLCAGCSSCDGDCPTPEACGLPIAHATKPPRAAFWMADAQDAYLSRFFFLAPLLARFPWLGPVLVACVVIVWTCIDAYLEIAP